MKGKSAFTESSITDGYLGIWEDMIQRSIRHVKKIDLSDVGDDSRLQTRECYESRCYILSDMFEDDCSWFDMSDEYIGSVRNSWKQFKTRCAVCGNRAGFPEYFINGRLVCWEHWKITTAYNKGYDLDEVMREIQKKKHKPRQMEFKKGETIGCVTPKLDDSDKQVICESYKNGRDTRFLAIRFGVTVRTIQKVVNGWQEIEESRKVEMEAA